jgi:hypothetical protein
MIQIFKEYGSFDWTSYVKLNNIKGLQGKGEAYEHMKNIGLYSDKIIYFLYEPIKCYENFSLEKYLEINDVKEKNKLAVWNKVESKNIPDLCFDVTRTNNLNVEYDDFDWSTYLLINPELVNDGFNTKPLAWKHWIQDGKAEERSFHFLNNSNVHQGRFGNLFFINIFLHLYASQFDLKCLYKYESYFTDLGIELYHGSKTYEKNFLLTDENSLLFLEKDTNKLFKPANIIIHKEMWLQNSIYCMFLKKYFEKPDVRHRIVMKNKYRNRYGKNNDLFIHLRLGDVTSKTSTLFEDYDNLLSIIDFDKGYISSDSIQHKFCSYLIEKYNLQVVDKSETNTIMFASTCKHLVLSGGTYSWLIGFFGFFDSKVYYFRYENPWYGDIFEAFNSWICINDDKKFDN